MPSTRLPMVALVPLPLLVQATLMTTAPPVRAAESPLCSGTLLEVVGNAELSRSLQALSISIQLEAEEASADAALEELQRRLARLRDALEGLAVKDLRVTSPTTWERPRRQGRAATTQASLRVTGSLLPDRLQPLIREVGALPGVRLAPVESRPDLDEDASVRRRLLRLAYEDALAQARDLGAVLGRSAIEPIRVVVQAEGARPMAVRAMAADGGVPPFDPGELPLPKERLTLQVRFCVR